MSAASAGGKRWRTCVPCRADKRRAGRFAGSLAGGLLLVCSSIILADDHSAEPASADPSTDEAGETVDESAAAAPISTSGSFVRRPYVAFGLGITRLYPESPTRALTVGDRSSFGFEFGLGYDITRWLSAELHIADLGEAGIDFLGGDVGDVGYLVFGATAVTYLLGRRDGFIPLSRGDDGAFRRRGLALFTRFGLGGMSNDSSLAYERDHEMHAVFGLGVEYGFDNGLALRAEAQGFDTDARYLGVSVLKRFGQADRAVAAMPEDLPAEPSPDTTPEPAAALPAPEPAAPEPVRSVDLPSAIYFAFDKAELSPRSMTALDRFADAMKDNAFMISIGGHTDWMGTERYNEGLSDRRADVVADYLAARGLPRKRMDARGFGETRPATSDVTSEGRALNRRTELRLR